MPNDPNLTDSHLDFLMGVDRLLREAEVVRNARDKLLELSRQQLARNPPKTVPAGQEDSNAS
jgi:hypothetical protein